MAAIQKLKTLLSVFGRLLLGLVFVYAGATKLVDPALFSDSIGHYHLLPYPLVVFAALYLPWLEMICGCAVLFRWRYRGALLLLVALCILFSVALASAWQRGLNIECGCFGRALASSLPVALLRSLGLGCLGGLLLLFSDQPTTPKVVVANHERPRTD